MKNKWKYAKEIMDTACSHGRIAVDKNGNVVDCDDITECSECIFWKDHQCMRKKLIYDWCEAEYVEKPTLTANEKIFLGLVAEPFKYIARDESEILYLYSNPPEKCEDKWHVDGEKKFERIWTHYFTDVNFDFIKWEDEKPWSIEDLKKLEAKK